MLHFEPPPHAVTQANATFHSGPVPTPPPAVPLPTPPRPRPDWSDPEELDPQPIDDAAWEVFELDPDEEAEPQSSDFPYFDRQELP